MTFKSILDTEVNASEASWLFNKIIEQISNHIQEIQHPFSVRITDDEKIHMVKALSKQTYAYQKGDQQGENIRLVSSVEINFLENSIRVYANPAYHTALRLNDCNTIYTSKAG